MIAPLVNMKDACACRQGPYVNMQCFNTLSSACTGKSSCDLGALKCYVRSCGALA